MRALEKYAVAAGGGTNHRFGLYDAILIKDNHVRLAGGVAAAIERARRRRPGMPIEVEAQSLEQVDDALGSGADTVLVEVRKGVVRRLPLAAISRAKLEVEF